MNRVLSFDALKSYVWLIMLSYSVSACSLFIKVPEKHQQAFLFGVEQLQAERYDLAAQAAWHYLQASTPEDARYDRALRLMARSSEKLGLSYASSLWYLAIAKGRRDAALIPEAIEGLRRIIDAGIYDEDTLVNYFLAVEDFPKLNTELDSFIHYIQGLHNMRQGLYGWAKKRFQQIHPQSPYLYKAFYASAVRRVALGKLKRAQTSFKALLKKIKDKEEFLAASSEKLPSILIQVRLDSLSSLARLAMHEGAAEKALTYFEQVRELLPNSPDLLLEIAWAHFKQGNLRKTLGYLLALDAPIYQDLIAPERYILEALTLKNLCQFGPAKQSAVRLYTRYKLAIDDVYQGIPPHQSKAMRAAASRRGELQQVTRLIDRLKKEQKIIRRHQKNLGAPLVQKLQKMYQRGLVSARTQREGTLRREVNVLSAELLNAEEQVRLISHELSVALLRGRQAPRGRAPIPSLAKLAHDHEVMYHFNGEFWTDELDDLVVAAEDRCIEQ